MRALASIISLQVASSHHWSHACRARTHPRSSDAKNIAFSPMDIFMTSSSRPCTAPSTECCMSSACTPPVVSSLTSGRHSLDVNSVYRSTALCPTCGNVVPSPGANTSLKVTRSFSKKCRCRTTLPPSSNTTANPSLRNANPAPGGNSSSHPHPPSSSSIFSLCACCCCTFVDVNCKLELPSDRSGSAFPTELASKIMANSQKQVDLFTMAKDCSNPGLQSGRS
mmetsp:Transcript_8174/g.16120  ORF Transcript_8174/g.16120 Transcript_8174/m.16120 type:complete len:224 (+) Transcript_8174:198-869(+)